MTFIHNNLTDYSVSQLCSALKFPRSTYYKALVRVPSNKQKEYEEFGRKVKQAYEDSKQRYGAVKICRILNDNGTPCSVKRVQRHMAEQGLRSVVVRKYNHRANHGSVPDNKVNILKRDFETETINQKWCTDITYIHVQKEGWIYLASEVCPLVYPSKVVLSQKMVSLTREKFYVIKKVKGDSYENL